LERLILQTLSRAAGPNTLASFALPILATDAVGLTMYVCGALPRDGEWAMALSRAQLSIRLIVSVDDWSHCSHVVAKHSTRVRQRRT